MLTSNIIWNTVITYLEYFVLGLCLLPEVMILVSSKWAFPRLFLSFNSGWLFGISEVESDKLGIVGSDTFFSTVVLSKTGSKIISEALVDSMDSLTGSVGIGMEFSDVLTYNEFNY